MKYIKGEFKDTGINTVDIEKIVESWSHLWFLSQYGSTFTLTKGVRKDSSLRSFKTAISAEQAELLIERLGLGAENCYPFRKAINWRVK